MINRILSICVCAGMLFCGLTFITKGIEISIYMRLGIVAVLVALLTLILICDYRKSQNAPRQSKITVKRDFDWSMHYFRAFAILTIMAMHYLGVFGYSKPVEVLFHSSTIFFLFISGYLCQFIDMKRRDKPLDYYRKKLLNVICPFIIFSLLFGYMKGIAGINAGFVKEVLLGRVQGQYWYIPFVSGLFLISPLICRLNNKRLMFVATISCLLFCVFPFRPGGFMVSWPETFYLYSYFTFFYIIGFVYCRHKSLVDKILREYLPIAAAVAVTTIILLAWARNLRLALCGYDYMMGVQKLSFIVLAVIGLSYLKNKKVWLLDQLAKYSFTLYFLHFGLFAQSHKIHDFLIQMVPLPLFIAEFLAFCLFTIGLLLSAMIFKSALGRFSRIIIGA